MLLAGPGDVIGSSAHVGIEPTSL